MSLDGRDETTQPHSEHAVPCRIHFQSENVCCRIQDLVSVCLACNASDKAGLRHRFPLSVSQSSVPVALPEE